MAEEVLDQDTVSRLLFEPSMRKEDKDLVWETIFQFPSNQGSVESVLWRAKIASIAALHEMGCNKQKNDRTRGRNSTYFGAITGNVGAIRAIRSASGASVTVTHVPEEGDAHVHLGFSTGASKNDRSTLKVLLRSQFGPIETHSCPDGPDAAGATA